MSVSCQPLLAHFFPGHNTVDYCRVSIKESKESYSIHMVTIPPQPQSQLALVSSLYGPGTITCWYLTTLSVLVSWTLHPRKRNLGSIDVDLIAVLTLPAVAAGHLVSQVREFLRQDDVMRPSGSADWKYLQSVAAIEAPFNVTETFMATSIILFIVAVWMYCVRRAIFVAWIGLLCFTVECYIHFSNFRDLGLRYKPGVLADNYPAFSRFFVADFTGLVTAILVILSLCGLLSAAIAFYMLLPSETVSPRPQQDVERVNEAAPRARPPFGFGAPVIRVSHSAEMINRPQRLWRFKESNLCAITMVSTLFLPLAFIASLLPLIWPNANARESESATTSLWQTLNQSVIRLMRDLFPRTACSITDLDQAVAAAAGATVLGFSIYSVGKAYYEIWNVKRTTPSEPIGTELSSFENRPVL